MKGLTPYGRITSDSWPIRKSASRHLDPRRYDKLAAVPGQIAWLTSALGGYPSPREDLKTLGILTAVDQALLDKGYRVASRSDINALLKEIGLAITQLTDSDAVRVGRLLKVQGVLILRISEATVTAIEYSSSSYGAHKEVVGHTITVNMEQRIVDVESGELAWSASQSVSGRFRDAPSEQQVYIDIGRNISSHVPSLQSA